MALSATTLVVILQSVLVSSVVAPNCVYLIYKHLGALEFRKVAFGKVTSHPL
jgi:hypothetical protein